MAEPKIKQRNRGKNMFGSKKQKTSINRKPKVDLSPKVAVANNLRLAALRAGKKETQTRKTAYAEIKAARTDTQKDAVRVKYRDNLRQLKLEADIAYATYENFIRNNFDSSVVEKVKDPKGNGDYLVFQTQRKFINELQKATNKKSTVVKPKAKKVNKTIVKTKYYALNDSNKRSLRKVQKEVRRGRNGSKYEKL